MFKTKQRTYFILHILVHDDQSFILTTDADVKFTHESVESLIDQIVEDPQTGAVCARTHPMGSGPVVWYQIFDYASGHWFQKVSSVVCDYQVQLVWTCMIYYLIVRFVFVVCQKKL